MTQQQKNDSLIAEIDSMFSQWKNRLVCEFQKLVGETANGITVYGQPENFSIYQKNHLTLNN